jgi:hypothetical protein
VASTAPASAPAVRIGRIVVSGTGDAATGTRIEQRLPGALQRALAGAETSDPRTIRRLVESAVREAAR